MTTSARVLVVLLACISCRSPSQQYTVASLPSPCRVLGRSVDSTFAVEQARAALAPSSPGLTLAPSSIDRVPEGLLMRMVVVQPSSTRGGGGFVFVNAETGCATVLIRYE